MKTFGELHGPLAGFHEDAKLLIKPGTVVIVPKGTKVTSTHPTRTEWITQRAQRVTVNHILNGVSYACDSLDRHQHEYLKEKMGVTDAEIDSRVEAYHDAIKEKGYKNVNFLDFAFHVSNPSVRWPGTGGYWNEVDMNAVILVDTEQKP